MFFLFTRELYLKWSKLLCKFTSWVFIKTTFIETTGFPSRLCGWLLILCYSVINYIFAIRHFEVALEMGRDGCQSALWDCFRGRICRRVENSFSKTVPQCSFDSDDRKYVCASQAMFYVGNS